MATGRDSASMGNDETVSSGNAPWTEKSMSACANCAACISDPAMARTIGGALDVSLAEG